MNLTKMSLLRNFLDKINIFSIPINILIIKFVLIFIFMNKFFFVTYLLKITLNFNFTVLRQNTFSESSCNISIHGGHCQNATQEEALKVLKLF